MNLVEWTFLDAGYCSEVFQAESKLVKNGNTSNLRECQEICKGGCRFLTYDTANKQCYGLKSCERKTLVNDTNYITYENSKYINLCIHCFLH